MCSLTMEETEPTTNDMVNLLRFLGNETEWTYQPNHDEAKAIQSFVHAKTSPQRKPATNDLSASPFVSTIEQQRGTICCVSPSQEEMEEMPFHTEQDIEYPTKSTNFSPLDVTELMTSELIDYDRFATSIPEEPKVIVYDLERKNNVEATDVVKDTFIQDNDSLSAPHVKRKRTEMNLDPGNDPMESPKTKRIKKKKNTSSKTPSKKSPKPHPSGPLRALSAYNFFFRDERDRILNNKVQDWSKEKEDALLQGHWNRDRSEKRVHCKTHGKLSFTALSKEVSRRWKALPSPQRDFYRRVAQRDWKRYEKELAETCHKV